MASSEPDFISAEINDVDVQVVLDPDPVPEPVVDPADSDWSSYTNKQKQRASDFHPAQVSLRSMPQETVEEPDEWVDAAQLGVSVWNDVPVVNNGPDSAPVPQQPLGEEIVESIKKPLYENPVGRAVIGGVGDAINGLIDTTDEIGQTITGESYIPFNLPTVPEGDAVAEGLARDITQFMTGFASAGGMALKGMTKLTAAGAAGDVTFDPTEGNFSTFLRELDIDNSVTQFLDSQVGEDASAEERLRGRLANVAEGGLMGASIDLIVGSLRWAKNNPEVTREALRKVLDKTTEFSTGGVIKEMPLERYVSGSHGAKGDEHYVSWDIENDPVFDEDGAESVGEDYALIEKIYVPEADRSSGVGRRILRESIHEIQQQHPDMPIKIAAYPFGDNTLDMEDLVNFYESEGFDVVNTDGHAVIMEHDGSMVSAPTTPKNMVITHNLSVDNLVNADKIGGLPMPSLAVTKNTNPLDGFGDITLVAKPEAFDPKKAKNKFFNADIYSPRYPTGSVVHEVDDAAISEANKNLSESAKHIVRSKKTSDRKVNRGVFHEHELHSDGINALTRFDRDSDVLLYEYLQSQGKPPRLKRLKKTTVPRLLQKYIPEETASKITSVHHLLRVLRDMPDHAHWIKDVRTLMQRELERAGEGDYLDDLAPFQRDRHVGAFHESMVKKIWDFMLEREFGAFVDTQDLGRKLTNAIPGNEGNPEFIKWVQDTYGNLIKKEQLFTGFTDAGNRKYVDHTIGNVLKMMKKESVRGGEKGGGIGRLRAQGAKEFKSLASMKADRGKLVGEDAKGLQTKLTQQQEQGIWELADRVNNSIEKYSGDVFGDLLDDYTARGWGYVDREYGVLPDDVKQDVESLLATFRDLDADYFEGKISGAVNLSDFSGAVMPAGKGYDKAEKILRKHGITDIKRFDNYPDFEEDMSYKDQVKAEKVEAMNELKHLFFSTAGAGVLADRMSEDKQ